MAKVKIDGSAPDRELALIKDHYKVDDQRARFIHALMTKPDFHGDIVFPPGTPRDALKGKSRASKASLTANPFRGGASVDLHLPGKHNQRSHGRRRVGDIDEALDKLGQGKQVILDQPSQVSTLLDKLAKRVKEAEVKGDKAPNINLCDVTVPGTNIFCHGNKGIDRADMPQLKGKVRPGSKGARIANDKGKVDLGEAFAEHLRRSGVGVKHDEVSASHLRATQDELVGAKVAGMAAFLRDGGKMAGSIFVSKDDYVVDGHHRWAAQVGVEYGGQDFKLPIERVDMPILEVLREARKFADGWGIEQKGFTGFQGSEASELAYNPAQPRDRDGKWTHYIPHGGGSPLNNYGEANNYYSDGKLGSPFDFQKSHWGGWGRELEPEEETAVINYATYTFSDINRGLRHGGIESLPDEPNDDPEDPTDLKGEVRLLDAAIDKGEMPGSVVAYRGGFNSALKDAYQGGELSIGDEIVDPGFVSTSLDPETAREFASFHEDKPQYVAAIGVPSGSKAAYIAGLSEQPGQYELVLPRNTRFEVLHARETEDEVMLWLEAKT